MLDISAILHHNLGVFFDFRSRQFWLSWLVNWCFEPSQPLRIIPGLKETFIKRHTIERANKAEIKQEDQSEKTESFGENLWNEVQLKGQ